MSEVRAIGMMNSVWTDRNVTLWRRHHDRAVLHLKYNYVFCVPLYWMRTFETIVVCYKCGYILCIMTVLFSSSTGNGILNSFTCTVLWTERQYLCVILYIHKGILIKFRTWVK
jgi:hypothetical protein